MLIHDLLYSTSPSSNLEVQGNSSRLGDFRILMLRRAGH